MGGKNSKREAPDSSAKVARSISLPIKAFTRRLSQDHGGSFRGKPLLEDVDDFDHFEEYQKLVELEKLNEKDNTGSTRSCFSPLRGPREEVIYEEEHDDVVAAENQQQTKVGGLKVSPAFSREAGRSRLASRSAPCLAELLGEAEGFVAVDGTLEVNLVDLVEVADVSSVGEDSEKAVAEVTKVTSATSQEDLLGSPRSCDAIHSDLCSAAEFVDKPLNVEPLTVSSVLEPNSELLCNGNASDVPESRALLEGNSLTTGDEDSDRSYHFTFHAQKYSGKPRTWRRLNRIACGKAIFFSLSDHLGCEGEGNMNGRGKVNLSFNNPGKRPPGSRRSSFADTRDIAWDSSSGKRMKDGIEEEDVPPSDIQPDAFAWGLMGQTDPFLGYDAAGFFGQVPPGGDQMSGGYLRRDPTNNSKATALARKVRGLRASPKPVSSLESCLRAQMADAYDRSRIKAVVRPLSFVSSAVEKDKAEDTSLIGSGTSSSSSSGNAVDESSPKPKQFGLPRLPNLSKFLKEYAAKLAKTNKVEDVTDGDTSCTGVSANSPTSSSPCDGNCSTMASFETLLFSFGVGLGVLFGSGPCKTEMKRLSLLLDEKQADLEALKLEFARKKSPARPNRYDSTVGIVSKGQHVKKSQCESEQQGDQMAELEAELEAELDQLTGGDSAAMQSQYSAFDELDTDGVASVVYGDLAPTGLPARIEEDSDEDLSPPAQPACLNNYAVSPRELTRLLRKLQTARQEEFISELEEDLEAALSKLESREKELEFWKDKVRRLTEVSFSSASGDECVLPCTPTKGVAVVGGVSTLIDKTAEISDAPRSGGTLSGQECPHHPIHDNGASASGTVLAEDLRSHPSLGPVIQEVETSLHTESVKQEPKDMGRKSFKDSGLPEDDDDVSNEFLQSMIEFEEEGSSQTEVAARDCRPILDNAQIITQLIDSVHGLESYGDRAESVELGSATPSFGLFSSSVSISDTWDHPVELATPENFKNGGVRGALFPRPKLVGPHPSRRTSCNSDLVNPVLTRKPENEDSPSPRADHCTAIVRYPDAPESSKSASDTSETETPDLRTPYSVKYIDSTMRPATEPGVALDHNPSFWVGVGRAGLTTPVEKVRQQLFKTPQSAPVQWPGELSPTVMEKIARWEGLMEGETPGPATGSDWECQSRASESEQQCAANSEYDDVNVFSEENLVLEAEEMLGKMLINRILEKSKCGSDALVRKAQSALATLERDDGVEADLYYDEDTYMIERTDSEADFSERASDSKEGWSDDQEKQQTSFLDVAVREEYEFFRRLEIISKDRKAMKFVKEKAAKEMANVGGMDFDMIPKLDLGSTAQPSPGRQSSGITGISSIVAEQQRNDLAQETYSKQLVEPNSRGSDNWLSRGDARQVAFRGSGFREDEVRSRRRL